MTVSVRWNVTVWNFLVSEVWKGVTQNSEFGLQLNTLHFKYIFVTLPPSQDSSNPGRFAYRKL